jgi:hypothetical protein
MLSSLVNLELDGTARPLPGPQSVVGVAQTAEGPTLTFEQAVNTSWGELQIDMEVSLDTREIEYSIGPEHFKAVIQPKAGPHRLVRGEATLYKETRSIRFPPWEFAGTAEVRWVTFIGPNYAWPGWALAAGRAHSVLAFGARSAKVAVIATKGLFIGRNVVTLTMLGATATAAAVGCASAVAAIAMLVHLGRQSRGGRELSLADRFMFGYATGLAIMTARESSDPLAELNERFDIEALVQLPWQAELDRMTKLYVEGRDQEALSLCSVLGKAALAQVFLEYFTVFGPDAWRSLALHHRTYVSPRHHIRRTQYLNTLRQQVKRGGPWGIPPLTIKGE